MTCLIYDRYHDITGSTRTWLWWGYSWLAHRLPLLAATLTKAFGLSSLLRPLWPSAAFCSADVVDPGCRSEFAAINEAPHLPKIRCSKAIISWDDSPQLPTIIPVRKLYWDDSPYKPLVHSSSKKSEVVSKFTQNQIAGATLFWCLFQPTNNKYHIMLVGWNRQKKLCI